MVERLKQIWAGFEQTTTRNLTGRGVENIIVPERADYAAEDYEFLPEDYVSPAEAAFSALREDIKAKGKKFGRGKKADKQSYAEDLEPTPMTERAFNGDELIRGMRSTAMRTMRADLDYERYLDTAEGKAAARKSRKKRFGIF